MVSGLAAKNAEERLELGISVASAVPAVKRQARRVCNTSSVAHAESAWAKAHPTTLSIRDRKLINGGFTFIELLATVMLIAIIMPAAMHCIALCTRLGGQSRKQIEAASLARAKLTELTVSQDWQTSQKSGDFGSDWPGYRWTADVSNWSDSTLRELDLTVLWQSQGREHSVKLSTLVNPDGN